MRLPLLAALLCAAVGASAAVYSTTWSMRTSNNDSFIVRKSQEYVIVQVELGVYELTREEAASLGRALLGAAGQPENVCASGEIRRRFYGGTGTLQCPPGFSHLSEGCEESK